LEDRKACKNGVEFKDLCGSGGRSCAKGVKFLVLYSRCGIFGMREAVYLAVGLVVLGCCVQGLASMFSDREAYIALAVMGKFLVVVGLMLLSLMFMESLPISIDVG